MDPRDFKSLLRQTVALPVLLVAILAGVLVWQIAVLKSAYDQVQETQQLENIARQFLRLVLDMETGARGYLLTGDRSFLDPYQKSEPRIPVVLEEMRNLVKGRSNYEAEVRDLAGFYGDWKQITEQLVAAGPNSAVVRDSATNLRGKQLMDQIRATRERLLNDLDSENQVRTDRIHKFFEQTMWVVMLLSAIVAIALAIFLRRSSQSLIQSYVRHLDAERRSTAESREAREWLMTTLRSMRESVITADEAGKITFMNPAAEALTGFHVEDVLSAPLAQTLSLEDELTREPLGVLSSPGQSKEAQRTSTGILRRADAQILYVEFSISPIQAGEEFAGSVLILRDISERRRSEAALRSSERLSLLGRLSATIAHEIRNPLDAVMNLIYLIRTSSTLDDTARGFAQTAEEELQRIAQITHQLLTFNREAKQPVETDVSELVSGVVKLFSPKLSAAGIEATLELDTKRKVIALPGELRQVFSNLVANAIDVLPRGGKLVVRVSEAREHGMREREGVRITVADNGPGIPESILSSLFTPFFTTKGEKGTGLGLWVSRGIITKHEGTLRLRSATDGPNRGTVFSIFLPQRPESHALRTPAA